MTFLILIGGIYAFFILDILYGKKASSFASKFIEKRPLISFALFAIVALLLYQSLLNTKGSHHYEDRPTDCEYSAYFGWACN